LAAWESGSSKPSVPQLQRLADLYKRSLAVFYLPAPPRSPPAVHDFRRLPDTDQVPTNSPKLLLAIRYARARRRVAADLARQIAFEPRPLEAFASNIKDPEAVGDRAREFLGVTLEQQTKWRDPHEAFNSWRSALESRDVLVFQFSGVEIEEARGFSLSEESPFP